MSETQKSSNQPRGVLLVGSVPLPTVEDVFQKMSKSLGSHIRRIPDGEVGVRDNWVMFQGGIFQQCPMVVRTFQSYDDGKLDESKDIPQDLIDKLSVLDTGYDTYALESYAKFCAARKQGQIAEGIRFQICLPTAVAVVSPHINPAYQETVEPFYEKALMRAMRRIQDEIPAEDLAIQFDLPFEIAMLEGFQSGLFLPWWSPIEEGTYQRTVPFLDAVDSGVELGLHFCYGDLGHQHFMEPKDTQIMVKAANTLIARSSHKIDWVHMPVPKARVDDAYFAPLAGLKLSPETELYLGLVHPEDESGTQQRIATAMKHVSEFGVGTECGMGRTPVEEMESILKISTAVAAPCA